MAVVIPFQVGERLIGERGSFVIQNELPIGGSGIIYLATRESGEQMAIKALLLPQHPSPKEEKEYRKVARMFYREMEHLQQLRDIPGVVELVDKGIVCKKMEDWQEEVELPWYAMPYFPGPDLFTACQNKSEKEKIDMLKKVVATIELVHQKNIMHCDLKPANILLDAQGEPVVLDFGIAHALSIVQYSLSLSMNTMGTPSYMAPEQFEDSQQKPDKPARSPRKDHTPEQRKDSQQKSIQTDIWALGVMMYELLAGKNPFLFSPSGQQIAFTPIQIAKRVCHLPLPSISEYDRNADPFLSEICYRALAQKPAERYLSATEMRNDLQNWKEKKLQASLHHAQTRIVKQDWPNAEFYLREAYRFLPDEGRVAEVCRHYIQQRFAPQQEVEIVFFRDSQQLQPLFGYWMHLKQTSLDCLQKIYYIHSASPCWVAFEKLGPTLTEIINAQMEMLTINLQPDNFLDILKEVRNTIAFCDSLKLPYPDLTQWHFLSYDDEEIGRVKIPLGGFTPNLDEEAIVRKISEHMRSLAEIFSDSDEQEIDNEVKGHNLASLEDYLKNITAN